MPIKRIRSWIERIGIGGGLMALAGPVFFAAWWFFGHVAQAEDTAKKVEVLEAIAAGLAELHKNADTAETAKRRQLIELCVTGKLDESSDECRAALLEERFR